MYVIRKKRDSLAYSLRYIHMCDLMRCVESYRYFLIFCYLNFKLIDRFNKNIDIYFSLMSRAPNNLPQIL